MLMRLAVHGLRPRWGCYEAGRAAWQWSPVERRPRCDSVQLVVRTALKLLHDVWYRFVGQAGHDKHNTSPQVTTVSQWFHQRADHTPTTRIQSSLTVRDHQTIQVAYQWRPRTTV
jgi:hypothetical protein